MTEVICRDNPLDRQAKRISASRMQKLEAWTPALGHYVSFPAVVPNILNAYVYDDCSTSQASD